jgi:glyoxylase-like metal-dependent hydrolase (beta-lactamase superfamily II)
MVFGVQALRPGLWHWSARHPEWTTEDDLADHGWGPEVSCYGFSMGDHLVLVDPVIPEGGFGDLLRGRDAVSVLTCPWHARDALKLQLPVYAPGDESERVRSAVEYAVGDTLPFGIEAFPGLEPIDLVLWVQSHKALVFGDTLVDFGNGLELPDDWGPRDAHHPAVLASLRRCLELPIELALPTHGPPADRAAFERAVQ